MYMYVPNPGSKSLSGLFTFFSEFYMIQNQSHILQSSTPSIHECALTCFQHQHCNSFVYGAKAEILNTGQTNVSVAVSQEDVREICTLSANFPTSKTLLDTHEDATHISATSGGTLGVLGNIKNSTLSLSFH